MGGEGWKERDERRGVITIVVTIGSKLIIEPQMFRKSPAHIYCLAPTPSVLDSCSVQSVRQWW